MGADAVYLRFERISGLSPDQIVERAFVAEELRVSERTLRHWIDRGEFPRPFEMGRKRCFVAGDVQEWIRERVQNSRNPGRSQGRRDGEPRHEPKRS